MSFVELGCRSSAFTRHALSELDGGELLLDKFIHNMEIIIFRIHRLFFVCTIAAWAYERWHHQKINDSWHQHTTRNHRNQPTPKRILPSPVSSQAQYLPKPSAK